MFASLPTVWIGRPCLRRTRYQRMSSEWQDDSRGPMARIHFPPPATHTNPITATDRVPADDQLGKPGNVGGSGETQMTITRREILRRAYSHLHPACPQAACQGVTLRPQQTPVLQCPMTKVGKSDGERKSAALLRQSVSATGRERGRAGVRDALGRTCSRRVSVTGGLSVPLPGAGPRVIGNQTTPSPTGNPTSRPGC